MNKLYYLNDYIYKSLVKPTVIVYNRNYTISTIRADIVSYLACVD